MFVIEGQQEKFIVQKSWDFVSSFTTGAIVIFVVLGVLAWIFGLGCTFFELKETEKHEKNS